MDRRSFINSSIVAGSAAAFLSGCSSSQQCCSKSSKSIITKDATILIQGDSITDAGRDRGRESKPNDQGSLGRGYAYTIANELLGSNPGKNLKIYNRGISGNKVYQLDERWQKDCLDLKPDVLSILIGVNDLWHTLDGKYDGSAEKYEKDYRALLKRTLKNLPEVKIIICEPFILPCGHVKDSWFPEFDKYRAIAKKMSQEFNTIFVPFQTMFNEAIKTAPASYWAPDGVHPGIPGMYIMAQEWIKTVSKA